MNSLIAAVSAWMIGGVIVGGIFLLIIIAFAFQYIGLYLQAWVSGAKVGLIDLIMMRFRKVNAKSVVINRIRQANTRKCRAPQVIVVVDQARDGAGPRD